MTMTRPDYQLIASTINVLFKNHNKVCNKGDAMDAFIINLSTNYENFDVDLFVSACIKR